VDNGRLDFVEVFQSRDTLDNNDPHLGGGAERGREHYHMTRDQSHYSQNTKIQIPKGQVF